MNDPVDAGSRPGPARDGASSAHRTPADPADRAALADRAAFAAEWREWHAEHERERTAPHGFLAVTDLQFVGEAPRRFDGIPGTWSLSPAGEPIVELDPALDADGPLELPDGTMIASRYEFAPIPERGGVVLTRGRVQGGAADRAGHGTGSIAPAADRRSLEVARRGGRIVLRPRDPRAPLRTNHTGTPTYAPDPRWRIPGRYRAFDAPRPTTVGSALAGLEHVYDAPGEVEFEIDGRPLRLTVFGAGRDLLALFTDATSGVTTYAANRSLLIPAPDADGRVALDFNRAVNLPCAYTDHATCPLPPRENRLPVAIEAGERIPVERFAGAD